MRHVLLLSGVLCLVALAIAMPVQHLSPWHPAPRVATMLQLVSPEPPTANDPIPALSSSPRIAVPMWSIYLGSVIALIVAAIMLRRCHAANQCQVVKRIYRSWRE
jgi:hypothetical protein